MKKFICIVLSLTLFAVAFVGCSSETQTLKPDEGSGTLSFFKRDAEYDAVNVCADTFPDFDGKVKGHTQRENNLYILTDSGVYTYDIISGESSCLIAGEFDAITSSDALELYSSERGELSSYSFDGEQLSCVSSDNLANWNINSFAVTDNYYVFIRYRYQTENSALEYRIAVYDKASKELSYEKDVSGEFVRLCKYRGDTVLVVYISDSGEDNCLYTFDAANNNLSRLRKAAYNITSACYDICYNEKANTAVLLISTEYQPMALCEYSLDNDYNASLYSVQTVDNPKQGSVSIYENVISFFEYGDSRYYCFDYLNPPKYLTVAFYDNSLMQNVDLMKIVQCYEKETEVTVRTMVFDNNSKDNLKIKLMAQDGDIDIFSTLSVGVSNCINQHLYVNLADYENLRQKISSDVFANFASATGDEYFGLPYGIIYTPNQHLNPTGFNAIEQYCIKNINGETGEYLDKDGTEFCDVLKYHYDNPNGSENEPYSFPYSVVQADYLIVNPASNKLEQSADFLEFFFDVMNGDYTQENPVSIFSPFIELESSDDVYLMWKFQADGVVPTLYTAYRSALETNGSGKELKSLAKSAARQLQMRLEG